ncbi:MAG TPA: YeaH/YhbH family protein [Hyphomicrobiaceae bacterium]|nr:YeaH/YhbH family protein [Hyphomicrobiaceae bacterium]
MHIIDRRLNPKAKSLGNRQRFLRRARAEIRESVRDALKKRKVSEVDGGEKVRIRSKGLREPSFGLGPGTGKRDYVLPGNKDFSVGDVIRKPESGAGGGGPKGSPDGEGEDDFIFSLTREEFLDVFFEDLKLPNLVKAKLKSLSAPERMRAGFTSDGPPSRLNRLRTMRNSLARRIALRRPRLSEIEALEREIAEEEASARPSEERLKVLKARLARLGRLRKAVSYLDPLDLKYNRYERKPRPKTQAVMFCLMDVSASMTEQLKDLAKRFFMLLHLFLSRHYSEVDVVFIRHTTQAQEVDEETFFRDTETGGTVISTALEEMLRIVGERYPIDDWNIYAAQASDGHNFDDDMDDCLSLLNGEVLPLCQYFAYIEVAPDDSSASMTSVVWSGYQEVARQHAHFAMKRVTSPGEIYPVFRELFASAEGSAREAG